MSEQAAAPAKTPGIVSWTELLTHDPSGSSKFYTELFGWSAETMQMGPGMEYTTMKVGSHPAAGMLKMPEAAKNAPTSWLSYVTVANLDESLAKAQALGAKVCKEATTIPMGRFVITDPQGAVLGLWEFGEGSCCQ